MDADVGCGFSYHYFSQLSRLRLFSGETTPGAPRPATRYRPSDADLKKLAALHPKTHPPAARIAGFFSHQPMTMVKSTLTGVAETLLETAITGVAEMLLETAITGVAKMLLETAITGVAETLLKNVRIVR